MLESYESNGSKFYTDVSVWIPERQEEFKDRKWFNPKDWIAVKDDPVVS